MFWKKMWPFLLPELCLEEMLEEKKLRLKFHMSQDQVSLSSPMQVVKKGENALGN